MNESTETPSLPPEPGSVPDLDHGYARTRRPASAEPPEDDSPGDDDLHTLADYDDADDEPDAFDGATGIPGDHPEGDGLAEPEDDSEG